MQPTSPAPLIGLSRVYRRSAPPGLGQPLQHVGARVGAKMPGNGRVLAQAPAAGTPLARGQVVAIVVGSADAG
jgi:hypothetical protein